LERCSVKKIAKLLGLAALLTMGQIVFAGLLSGAHSPGEAYFKLLNWDSEHYAQIANQGYQIPAGRPITSEDVHEGRANVVFFPGYPFGAKYFHDFTGASIQLSMLLIAHAASILAWFYFLLLLSEAGMVGWEIGWPVIAVLVYPSAFFLVTGYTESLFLAASLGFIYWCDRWNSQRSAGAWWIALLHGWVLAITRIVGFAVAAYPAFGDVVRKRLRFASVMILGLSVLVSVSFFAYCQIKFGDWAIYFHLEEIGWDNHRKYFAIINPLSYVPHFFFENTIDSVSRCTVTLGGVLFAVWSYIEWKLWRQNQKLDDRRIARGMVAFTMFYIALTGKANSNFDSMTRYTLPVYVLMVLNFADLKKIPRGGLADGKAGSVFFSGRGYRWKLGFMLFLSFSVECWCIYRFTHGRWVA
jgi:hypothetical protein